MSWGRLQRAMWQCAGRGDRVWFLRRVFARMVRLRRDQSLGEDLRAKKAAGGESRREAQACGDDRARPPAFRDRHEASGAEPASLPSQSLRPPFS